MSARHLFRDQAIDRAVESRLSVPDPMSDLYASGEYRAALAAAYGKRALKKAVTGYSFR